MAGIGWLERNRFLRLEFRAFSRSQPRVYLLPFLTLKVVKLYITADGKLQHRKKSLSRSISRVRVSQHIVFLLPPENQSSLRSARRGIDLVFFATGGRRRDGSAASRGPSGRIGRYRLRGPPPPSLLFQWKRLPGGRGEGKETRSKRTACA